MIAEDSILLHLAALAWLLLLFVALRKAKRQEGGLLRSLLARPLFTKDRAGDRMFGRRQVQSLKNCPNCTEQQPLLTLICEACKFNFLSGMVGHGHQQLPAPEPEVDETPKRSFG